MNQLYGPDMPKPLNFTWIMERVRRCEDRIWRTASAFALTGGNVVLDLGFVKVENRTDFMNRAKTCGLSSQLHFIDAPDGVRRKRVLDRNTEKGETYSFEVTPGMFDFMEKEFERPTEAELTIASVTETTGFSKPAVRSPGL